MARTTTEVIQDHLMKRLAGDIKADVDANYSPDVILLSSFGTFRGKKGIMTSAEKLDRDMKDAEFIYNRTQIEGSHALLEWSANKASKKVCDGVDSFMVQDGKIVFQSVHYSVV